MFNTDLSGNQDKNKNSRSKLIKSCPNNRYYRRVIIKHAKSSEGCCGPVKEREGHKSRDASQFSEISALVGMLCSIYSNKVYFWGG